MIKIDMYWRPGCGFCQMARQLLQQKSQQFTFELNLINIWEEPNRRNEMIERTQGTTVPQIIINDQPVGGYTELSALDHQGQLDAMLS